MTETEQINTAEQLDSMVMNEPQEALQERFVIIPYDQIGGTFYQEKGNGQRADWVVVFKYEKNADGLRQVKKVFQFTIYDGPLLLVTPSERIHFNRSEELHGATIDEYVFELTAYIDTSTLMMMGQHALRVACNDISYEDMMPLSQTCVREMTHEEKVVKEKRLKLAELKSQIRRRAMALRRRRLERQQEELRKREEKEREEKTPRFIRYLSEAAERIYPGRSEVKLTDDGSYVKVMIHFPEVEIINSKGGNHKIFDLFVSFRANPVTGKVYDQTLNGDRTSINYAEYISTYAHSHLPGEGIRVTTQFCLNGGNLQTLLTDVRVLSFYDNPERWMMIYEAILFQLESYVSWESLEGSCYRKIKDISTKHTVAIDVNREAKIIARRIDPDDTPPLTYVKGVGFQLASSTEAFEDWLVKYAGHITQFKNDRGEYYNDEKGDIPTSNFVVKDSIPVNFKGKIYPRTVRVDFYHENKEKRKKYCNGQVKGVFVQWANNRLQRAFAERNLRTVFRDVLARNKKEANAYSITGKGKAKHQSNSILEAFTPVSDV